MPLDDYNNWDWGAAYSAKPEWAYAPYGTKLPPVINISPASTYSKKQILKTAKGLVKDLFGSKSSSLPSFKVDRYTQAWTNAASSAGMGNDVSGYMQSKGGLFNLSKLNNPFSKGNLKSGASSGLLQVGAGIVGNLGYKGISEGYDAKGIGKGINTIGSSVGSAVGMVNPLLGAGITAASGILGGTVNRFFGTKTNQEALNTANSNISRGLAYRGNANSFDSVREAPIMLGHRTVYKGGHWNHKVANKKNEQLAKAENYAGEYARGLMLNNIATLNHKQTNNMLANYSAFGGPLFGMVNGPTDLWLASQLLAILNKKADSLNKPALIPNNLANINAFGGDVQTHGSDWSTGFSHINKGGTHEENPKGGVTVGQDNQGVPNMVEEGEVIANTKEFGGKVVKDYVFSDRLTVPEYSKEYKKEEMPHEMKVLKKYEGKTFAEGGKMIEKNSGVDERPNDVMALNMAASDAYYLMQAQEKERMKKMLEELMQQIDQLPPEEAQQALIQIAQMMQQAQSQENEQQQPAPEEQQIAEQQAMQQEQVPPYNQEAVQELPVVEEPVVEQEAAVPQLQEVYQLYPDIQAQQQPLYIEQAYGGNLYAGGGDLITEDNYTKLGLNMPYSEFLKLPILKAIRMLSNYNGKTDISGYIKEGALNKAREDYEKLNDLEKAEFEDFGNYFKNPSLNDSAIVSYANQRKVNNAVYDPQSNLTVIVSPQQNTISNDVVEQQALSTAPAEEPSVLNDRYNQQIHTEVIPTWEQAAKRLNDKANDEYLKDWKDLSNALRNVIIRKNKKDPLFKKDVNIYTSTNKEYQDTHNAYVKLSSITLDNLKRFGWNDDLLKFVSKAIAGDKFNEDAYNKSTTNEKYARLVRYANSRKLNNLQDFKNLVLDALPKGNDNILTDFDINTLDYKGTPRYNKGEWVYGKNDKTYSKTGRGDLYQEHKWYNPKTKTITIKDYYKNPQSNNSRDLVFSGNEGEAWKALETSPEYLNGRWELAKDLYEAEKKAKSENRELDWSKDLNNSKVWQGFLENFNDRDNYLKENSKRLKFQYLFPYINEQDLTSKDAFMKAWRDNYDKIHKAQQDVLGRYGSGMADLKGGILHGVLREEALGTPGQASVYYVKDANGNKKYVSVSPDKQNVLNEYFTIGKPIETDKSIYDDKGNLSEKRTLYETELTPKKGVDFDWSLIDSLDDNARKYKDYFNVGSDGKSNTPPFPRMPIWQYGPAMALQVLGIYNGLNNLGKQPVEVNKAIDKTYNTDHLAIGAPFIPLPSRGPYQHSQDYTTLMGYQGVKRGLMNNGMGPGAGAAITNAWASTIPLMAKANQQRNEGNWKNYMAFNEQAINTGAKNQEAALKADITNAENYGRSLNTKTAGVSDLLKLKYDLMQKQGDALGQALSGAANLYNSMATNQYNNQILGWGMEAGNYGVGPHMAKQDTSNPFKQFQDWFLDNYNAHGGYIRRKPKSFI